MAMRVIIIPPPRIRRGYKNFSVLIKKTATGKTIRITFSNFLGWSIIFLTPFHIPPFAYPKGGDLKEPS
jgi:hypothetical protein